MKFRRKTLWRYIKQKQHKFFESYPFLGLFGTWNSRSNKQSSTTLKKNGGHKTQSYKKKLSLELINETMLKTNPDKWNELETATLDSRNGDKWYKDGLKLRQSQRKSAIKNNKISKSDMASSSICEMTGFERQGPYVTPLPPGGPHKSPLSYPWSNLTPVPFESPTFHLLLVPALCRGRSTGRVQWVRTPPPDLQFSNTTCILQKTKLCGLLVLK